MLTGKQFFPQLISGPFHNGLVVVFTAAAVMMAIGAAASWVNPGRTVDDSTIKPSSVFSTRRSSPLIQLSLRDSYTATIER